MHSPKANVVAVKSNKQAYCILGTVGIPLPLSGYASCIGNE